MATNREATAASGRTIPSMILVLHRGQHDGQRRLCPHHPGKTRALRPRPGCGPRRSAARHRRVRSHSRRAGHRASVSPRATASRGPADSPCVPATSSRRTRRRRWPPDGGRAARAAVPGRPAHPACAPARVPGRHRAASDRPRSARTSGARRVAAATRSIARRASGGKVPTTSGTPGLGDAGLLAGDLCRASMPRCRS